MVGYDSQRVNEVAKTPRELLINEIVVGPDFSHSVFGCFGGGGHRICDLKGAGQIPNTLLENEKVYRSLFIKDKMRGPEFQVRVAGLKIAKAGGILVMCFNDRQEDSRGGSHTAYALAIPSTKLARIYMAIETDPSIMIDIFRRLYPTYDRSGGQLAIDPGCPKVVPMAEDIIK